MKTPFEILGVDETADDQLIKKAYLAEVRRFPPERFPEEFKRIREAYEKISTAKARLRYLLFDTRVPAVEEIAGLLLDATAKKRPAEEKFRALLAHCLRECRIFHKDQEDRNG